MKHPLRRSRGFAIVEVLGALALVALLSAAIEDTRGQHAGEHQAQVVQASQHYVQEHYADLLTVTSTAPVAVPIGLLSSYLPTGFQTSNAYGQTPCVRVMQPLPGKLNVLIVSEGGQSIPTKDLAYVAAHAGPGGGQITAADPTTAQGVFGSWTLATSLFGGVACPAPAVTTTPTNRLASAQFYDGPGTAAADFLYRGVVPGHPELNALDVPLGMRGSAVAVEDDATDPLCSVADPLSQGRIGVTAGGVVVSCQSGVWRRQGSAFWKDPVADVASLPLVGNDVGDVRMAMDVRRGFVWDGAGWIPLAVDAAGDMTVPRKIVLTDAVAPGSACDTVGSVSRAPGGETVSCQGGVWKVVGAVAIDPSQSEIGSEVIMKSNYMTYPPGTTFYPGPFPYDAPDDTVMATVERPVMPTKDGLLISNVSMDMSVGTIATPTDTATVTLIAQVIDNDTGLVLATNQARQSKMVYDRAILAVTLSKALPKNASGYTFQMMVRWSRRMNNYASNFYDRSNYLDVFGNVVELTPIQLSWNFDLTY